MAVPGGTVSLKTPLIGGTLVMEALEEVEVSICMVGCYY